MNKRDFEDLSEIEQFNLINDYYASDKKLKEIIEEYGINATPSNLYNKFPPLELSDLCVYCGCNILRHRLRRSEKEYSWRNLYDFCPQCDHRPNDPYCKCENCRRSEQIKKEKLRAIIVNTYGGDHSKILYEDLSFENKVYLGALVSALADEKMTIRPYHDSRVKLSSSETQSKEIYDKLLLNKVIMVDHSSPLSAFDVESDSFPYSYYPDRVGYRLCVDGGDNSLFDQIINPSFYNDEHVDEAFAMWKEIALSECLEYLMYKMKEFRFAFTPGEKTLSLMKLLLEDFSVSQIYCIIYKGINDACRQKQSRQITDRHAANTAIAYCRYYADRIKQDGWTVGSYRRISELPQGVLSSYFFYSVLKIGNRGFDSKPNIDDLKVNFTSVGAGSYDDTVEGGIDPK